MRMIKLEQILPEKHPDGMVFLIGDKVVCEKSFATVIGMIDKVGNRAKTWTEEVSVFLGECVRLFIY